MTKINTWSKDAITFKQAKKGFYKGSFLERKNGFGPEFWSIEVYELNGKLYGGVEYMGMLEPMLEDQRENILKMLKNNDN